ncbi:MAG: hypothetical protein AAGN35_26925 [Bacteroidota bacterium]
MNLKHVLIPLFFLAFMVTALAPVSASGHEKAPSVAQADAYVYIYLKNSCSHDVKYAVKYPGHGSSGTVYKNNKKRLTVQPGAKIYIDGDFLMEVEDSDDGEDFIVCR